MIASAMATRPWQRGRGRSSLLLPSFHILMQYAKCSISSRYPRLIGPLPSDSAPFAWALLRSTWPVEEDESTAVLPPPPALTVTAVWPFCCAWLGVYVGTRRKRHPSGPIVSVP